MRKGANTWLGSSLEEMRVEFDFGKAEKMEKGNKKTERRKQHF